MNIRNWLSYLKSRNKQQEDEDNAVFGSAWHHPHGFNDAAAAHAVRNGAARDGIPVGTMA